MFPSGRLRNIAYTGAPDCASRIGPPPESSAESLLQSGQAMCWGWAMNSTGASLVTFLLAICVVTGAMAQDDEEILSNADIVTLVEAGLSSSAIVAVIESRGTDFDTSVAQLAALSRAGVDSAVIEAMARASASRRSGAAAPQAPGTAASSRSSAASPSAPQAGAAPSTASARQPGETFSDTLSSGGQGPEMVVIPAGRFRMGCVSGQDCGDDELPVHEVMIPQAFAVSKYEVTFEDYDRFTYPNRVDDEGWGRGRRPVINVSWDDAQEYVAWLSQQTGQTYRLLSEAEWEYVARAGSSSAYSWGNDIGTNRANCDGCGSQWDYMQTAPVGSFPANVFGVHDMHGNVWEWVEDCWNGSYAGAPSDGSAWRSGNCEGRVLRGGSWYGFPRNLRSANRGRDSTGVRSSVSGFRVARTLTP